ncbi:MAG: B12-binding domain-containing radical SAM protein [Gemmatimonadales bacterium]
MRRLRIGVLDLVTKAPTRALYARIMHPNLASIMPQVVGAWCERTGHDVHFVCYTGFENLLDELPGDLDLLFVGAFTQSAQLAYAVSNLFRQRGAVTVLGGPHARCYPEDASKYFDYVLGFTDQSVVEEVLADCAPYPKEGRRLMAPTQPRELPSLRERWKFVEATLAKAPTIRIVPLLGSLGCPYTCSFCIDSTVPYQPLGFAELQDDLKFLVEKVRDPIVAWHDPNFGVRFDDYMHAIEEAVPQGRMRHIAESSLSLLSEPHLQRLKRNGFQAMLPGIESWFGLGNKSKTRHTGMVKVKETSDHINLILSYIPYVQVNFVLGLDCDEGPEPFELTKAFLDRAPGAFPAYSLLSAFGRAAPINLEYQRGGRVIPFPFHLLNNNHAMNVRPQHYDWPEFYDRLVDLSRYSFSWRAIRRRLTANKGAIPRWMNVVRAVSSEGFGRIKYHTQIRTLLDADPAVRAFMDGRTAEVPEFYVNRIRNELGPLWDHLPEGALHHDPLAYLRAEAVGVQASAPIAVAGRRG